VGEVLVLGGAMRWRIYFGRSGRSGWVGGRGGGWVGSDWEGGKGGRVNLGKYYCVPLGNVCDKFNKRD
jgi:hypothetical protein